LPVLLEGGIKVPACINAGRIFIFFFYSAFTSSFSAFNASFSDSFNSSSFWFEFPFWVLGLWTEDDDEGAVLS